MDEETWDVVEQSEQAWADFEERLEEYVDEMPAGARLELRVPVATRPEEGETPWVRIAREADHAVVSVTSNHLLAAPYALQPEQEEQLLEWDFVPPDTAIPGRPRMRPRRTWLLLDEEPIEAGDLAGAAVRVLREIFGVIDPALLVVDGEGDEGGWIRLASFAEPEEDDGPPVLIKHPAGQAELRELIGQELASWPDEVSVDDDGDHVFVHGDLPVYVRALPEEPTVEIFTRLTHGVHSRRQAAVEVSILNRQHPKLKFQLYGRSIFQVMPLPAMPFVGEHLWSGLEQFLEVLGGVRDDLALRVGGRG